jgi:transposase
LKPQQSRYWLNHNRAEDPEQFATDVQTICELYQQAPHLHEQGVHLVSTDEKTGIQANERAYPTRPLKPGLVERVEFEDIRHGTQTLIANFEVATGQVLASSVGPTRTEEDFVSHVEGTLVCDPAAEWIFIVDRLNTHQSESLVRFVADQGGIHAELGVKGKSGILASMPTRVAFLHDPTHRIRFVYTPKHTSWLHQVEIWCSILVRRLLKRASFTSVTELRQRLLAFIEYFNKTMAKPFKWTYRGRPLAA